MKQVSEWVWLQCMCYPWYCNLYVVGSCWNGCWSTRKSRSSIRVQYYWLSHIMLFRVSFINGNVISKFVLACHLQEPTCILGLPVPSSIDILSHRAWIALWNVDVCVLFHEEFMLRNSYSKSIIQHFFIIHFFIPCCFVAEIRSSFSVMAVKTPRMASSNGCAGTLLLDR